MKPGDAINAVAKRKKGETGWEPFRYEFVGGGIVVIGGVPVGTYTRGPRKGSPKWDTKTATAVIVTEDEIAAEQARAL